MIRTLNTVQVSTPVLREIRKSLDTRQTENLWVVMSRLDECLLAREQGTENEYELIFTIYAWDDFLSALAWHAATTSVFVTWADFWVVVNNFVMQWSEFQTEGDYRRFYGDSEFDCPDGIDGVVECALGRSHGCDHTGKTDDGRTVTWSRYDILTVE